MKIKKKFRKIIAMTLVFFMLPWPSFMSGFIVQAGNPDDPNGGYESGDSENNESKNPGDSQSDNIDEELDSIYITENMVLDEDLTVASFSISDNASENISVDLNGHTLEVRYDYIQGKGTLDINGGKLKVVGSAEIDSLIVNNGLVEVDGDLTVHYLKMVHKADTVKVLGNFIYGYSDTSVGALMKVAGDDHKSAINSKIFDDLGQQEENEDIAEIIGESKAISHDFDPPLTAGTLTVGGDFYTIFGAFSSFFAEKEHKVILNGKKKQIIDNPNGHFATLEFQNYSEEGIYSEGLLHYDKLIKNGCKFRYNFGEAADGFILKEDRTISGDLIFAEGEIDLNGHTLTVDGNLIHAGGRIKINNGKLIVKKDLREQVPYKSWTLRGEGSLCLEADKDEIVVYGDVYLDSDETSDMKTGTLIINGDIHTSLPNTSFDFGTKIILNSSGSQTVDSNVRGFNNLEINTKDTVTFENSFITVKGNLKSTCKDNKSELYVSSLNNIEYPYYGNINLFNYDYNYHDILEKNVEIYGNLYIQTPVELNGKSITVSDLEIAGSSYFVMKNEKDYIKVKNDMTIYGTADSMIHAYYRLTDGTIEISGDFKCDNKYDFIPSGNHKVILNPVKDANGQYITQNISFGNNSNSRFNKLVLRGIEEAYSFDNDLDSIASEIICEFDDKVPFKSVTDLKTEKITENEVALSFVDNNNPRAVGYKIYRDGECIATIDKTEYTDINLTPETKYEYSVYAFDAYNKLSEVSDVLVVQTLKDEVPPTAPKNIDIVSLTGSTVGLKWVASTDNVGVVRYILYRNGEAIEQDLKTLEYVDKGLAVDKIYKYEIAAVDAAGNISEKCDAIETQVAPPKITSVMPSDYEKIGGSTVQFKIYYKKYGTDIKNSLNIFYKNDADEWVKINDADLEQKGYNSSEYVSSCDWDISNFESGNVMVRFELTDESGEKSVYETEYEIDHTAPEQPDKLTAEDHNGVVKLGWKVSGESDFFKYNVYRYVVNEKDDKEVYTKLTDIPDRYDVSYEDNTLKEGTLVKYIVTATDDKENESPLINAITITVGRDEVSPEIAEITPHEDRISGNASITAAAKDNKDVSEIIFYILNEKDEDKTKDKSAWTEIGRSTDVSVKNDKFATSINIDTTKYEDGIYFIAALAKDSSGNISNDNFYKRFEIDNIGIEKIKINKTNVGSTYVQLMWDDVTENDFSYFSVEKLEGETFKEIKKVSDTAGCTIDGLTPETSYTFRVCGVDNLGNKGEYSDEVTLLTLKDTTAPCITAVYPVQGRVKGKIDLSMSVTDNYKVAYVIWSYSLDGETYSEIAKKEGNSASQKFDHSFDISDTDMYPEGDIYIKSEAYDMAGNKNLPVSDGSEIIMKYTIDRTAPDAVKNVSAVAYDGYISVNWDKNSEEDVVKYQVYRAQAGADSYLCVMNEASLNYYDTSVDAGESYEYYVIAVDEAGNESEKSNVSYATALPDETAPKVNGVSPANGLKIGASTSFSVVVTDNSALSKVETYYRTSEDDPWTLLNETKTKGRSALLNFTADFSNEKEGSIYFKTVCEDRNNNRSEDFLYSCTLDKTAPKASIVADGGNFLINLRLDRDALETDIAYYEIYRGELSSSGQDILFYLNASSLGKCSLAGEITEKIGSRTIYFTDKDVTPHVAYRYAAKVYDSVGNFSWTPIVNAFATDIDDVAPTIIAPDKITSIVGMEVGFDAGKSTDNVKIKSFKWDMGNGDVKFGARPKYRYTKSGRYTVKLTVTDTSGNSSEKEIELQVNEEENSGICNLTVVDYEGKPIPYAYVYVKALADSNTTFMTDASGKISLCYKSGTYTVAAFKDGYLPEEQEFKISNMKETEEVLRLSSGEVVVGQFDVHRMSIQEMVDAGVDLSDPANLNTFTFKTTLTFQKTPIPVNVEVIPGNLVINASEDDGGSGYFGTHDFSINWGEEQHAPQTKVTCINVPSEEPVNMIAVMSVTQSVSWLKTMYSADLTIINMADSKYVLEDSRGTIELPEGVSLAVLDKEKQKEAGNSTGQKLTIDMGDIPGQKSKTVSWTLKGDKSGKFDINAVFTGILTPFNIPITKSFKAETEMEVEKANVEIVVMPEDAYYLEEEYYIQYSITNKGEEPLYNFTTSIGDKRVPSSKSVVYTMDPNDGSISDISTSIGKNGYTLPKDEQIFYMPVLSGGDTISIPVLEPGQTIYGTWKAGDEDNRNISEQGFVGDADKEYFKLIKTLVEVIEGENLGVTVKVKHINSHISKVIRTIYREEDVVINVGDPVDTTTGAFTDEINVLSLQGKDILSYDLSYNSLIASDESLDEYNNPFGKGWIGDYSSSVKEENGIIKYYSNPYIYCTFIAEDSYNGKIYGKAEKVNGDETDSKTAITLSSMAGNTDDIRFVSVTHGMEGYVLTRHSDGTYDMESPIHKILSYDKDGRLVKIKMEDGGITTLDYTDTEITITEEASGNKIILELNSEGKIIKISDGGVRVTKLKYDNGNISVITDALGNKTSYEYDDKNRIVSEKNNSGNTYVLNSYDDQGRVTRQLDPYGKEITFEYTETDEGELICKITTKAEGYDDVTRTVISDVQARVTSVTNEAGLTERYTYDNDGNVSSYTNFYGNTADFTYDKDGKLLKAEGCEGKDFSAEYDENGNITSLIAGGVKSEYSYDENNNLILSNVGGAETKYTYSDDGIVSSQTKTGKGTMYFESDKGRITAVTDENGNKTLLEYDDAGNLIKLTTADNKFYVYNYNALNQKVSETDLNGNTTSYAYDDYNNVVAKTDALGNISRYEYDTAGNLTKAILPNGTSVSFVYDAAGNLVKKIYPNDTVYLYEYDSFGRNTKITYPDGTSETLTYDSNGRVTTSADQKGNIISYSYNDKLEKLNMATDSYGNQLSYDFDEKGRLIRTALSSGGSNDFTYDASGNILSKTDSLGNTVNYEYNCWDELIKEVDSNNNVTSYIYDASGHCIEKILPSGLDIHYSYDSCYNIVQIKTEVQGKEIIESYTYDAMGNVLSYTDTMGRKTEYTYDELNRLKSEKGIDGSEVTYVYDSVGNLIEEKFSNGGIYTAEYDELGRITSSSMSGLSEDEASKVYKYQYDSMGRLISTIDPMNYETSTTYDELGNVTQVTDAMGGTTSYTYDETSRLIAEENAIGVKIEYSYNSKGYLISRTNGRGQTATFEYDDLGRLIKMKDETGEVSYAYDKNGNLTEISDESGTITRKYDNLNRVTEATDCNGKTVKYGYDELGNIISLTYPGGEIVRYEYNPDLSLKNITDGEGRITSYEYDSAGRLIKTINPDGSVETKTYDDAGNLKTDVTVNASGRAILSFEYSYDGFGNITSVKDNIDFSGNVDYSQEASGVVDQSSDASSNSDTSGATSSVEMKYDAANRLISYNGEEVKYDADGNMIYGPLNGKMTEFEYDSRNRLIRAGDVRYRYDAENVRIAADYPEYTEEYVIDRENAPSRTLQIIRTDKNSGAESDNLGNVINYYYGIALIYEKERDKIRVYHFDHLGSTRNITDEKGNICYRFRYGTFGELLSVWDGENTTFLDINKTHPVRFLYNGALGVATDNNGLMYMRQRYYNTDIKRFINQDILSGSATLSQSLNKYAYVQGNPINYNDPFGLSPRKILQPYVNLAHDILRTAAMIPGPVGAIATICDIGLSYATGDFSALGKSLLSAIITGGFKTYINNACKIPKALKYIAGAVFAGYGLSIISKSYTMIRDSALQFVDLMFSGGSPLDYAHVLCNFFQGLAGLAGGVGFAVGSAVGMVRQCFVAGTKVKTEEGDKNIEDIEEGDLVWAYDPVTGETGLKEVKQTFENETETLVHVTVSNENDKETIDTTVRHPFYVVGYGFRYASELRIGDKVRSVSGDIYEVTSVEIEKLDEPVKIYNFEVEDWHTYFVSESGILVHNDGCGTGTPNTTEDTKQQDTDNITNQSTSAPDGKGGSEILSGTRFPEDPNQLFPENYAGLTKEIKPNGNIDFTVEAGGKTYKIEYHVKHSGEGHYDGNHYHVLKLGETPKPGKTKPPFFRLPNLDPNTPAQGGTFAPGDLLPTRNNKGGI